MLSQTQIQNIQPKIKTFQIIVSAMFMGAAFYLLIVFFVRGQPKFTQDFGLLPLIGAVIGVSSFMASLVAPFILNRQAVKALASEDSTLKEDGILVVNSALAKHQSNSIIRSALFEGGTFANIVMYQVSGSVLNLGISILGLLLILSIIPFHNKVINSLEWLIESAKEECKLST